MIEILTAEEAGSLLRLSPTRVLLLARRGELPSFHIDGRIRFDAAELEDWIRAQRPTTGTRPPPRVVSGEIIR